MVSKIKIRKFLLLAIVLIFLLSLTFSCKSSALESTEKVKELEEKIKEAEKEKEELKIQLEEKIESEEKIKEAEKEIPITEVIGKTKKEFSPEIISSLYLTGYSQQVSIKDNFAYVAGQGLNIIDIEDKNKPKLISTTASMDWINQFVEEDDYVHYTTTTWDQQGNSASYVKVIDVSEKQKPIRLGSLKTKGDIRNFGFKEHIFVSYYIYEEFQSKGGIEVIDISDKNNLVSIGSFDAGESGGGPLFIEEYCYFYNGNALNILSIEDISNIHLVNKYYLASWGDDLFINNNHAYVITGNTIQIINIADENATIVGGVFVPGYIGKTYIEDNHLYVTYVIRADYSENWIVKESGLVIIDLEDKNHPSIVAKVDVPGEAMGIFVEENFAYVAAGGAGLQIIKLFDK